MTVQEKSEVQLLMYPHFINLVKKDHTLLWSFWVPKIISFTDDF